MDSGSGSGLRPGTENENASDRCGCEALSRPAVSSGGRYVVVVTFKITRRLWHIDSHPRNAVLAAKPCPEPSVRSGGRPACRRGGRLAPRNPRFKVREQVGFEQATSQSSRLCSHRTPNASFRPTRNQLGSFPFPFTSIMPRDSNR